MVWKIVCWWKLCKRKRIYGTLYNDDKNSSRKLYISFDFRCICIQDEKKRRFSQPFFKANIFSVDHIETPQIILVTRVFSRNSGIFRLVLTYSKWCGVDTLLWVVIKHPLFRVSASLKQDSNFILCVFLFIFCSLVLLCL